jgi:hypothetical protein
MIPTFDLMVDHIVYSERAAIFVRADFSAASGHYVLGVWVMREPEPIIACVVYILSVEDYTASQINGNWVV